MVCDDGPRFTAILITPGKTIVTDKARSAHMGVSLVRGLRRVFGRQHLEAAKIQSLYQLGDTLRATHSCQLDGKDLRVISDTCKALQLDALKNVCALALASVQASVC